MGKCIPDFSSHIDPLRQTLERAYTRAGGKRTTIYISKINLSDIAWGREEQEEMESIQEILSDAVSLEHLDPENICESTHMHRKKLGGNGDAM